MQPAGEPSPELVWETINAHVRTAALRTAVEIDLFTAIGEGCADVPALARRCQASERGVRTLADYLVIIGLLAKQDGRYAPTPTSAAFLDGRSPTSLSKVVLFLNHPQLCQAYDELTKIVRTGRTVLPGDGTVEADNPLWVEFAHGMAPMMGPMAGPLGEIALADGAGPMRVLDIAAGHGLFGIEIAKQNPEARVVALDWASVLEVAKENAARAGVRERYQTITGSAFEADFGGPYDVVLLTNFLHHFDHATCVKLLEKVRANLAPGGRAVTLEFVPDEDRVSPPIPASFAMTMLTSTAAGDAYTYSELDRMHRDAGFARTAIHPVPRSPHMVVVGHLG